MDAQNRLREILSGKTNEQLTLRGMIKEGSSAENVLFSFNRCEGWVELPTRILDHVEQVGVAKCKEHEHPRVVIKLKAPADPDAMVAHQLLASLLKVLKRAADIDEAALKAAQLTGKPLEKPPCGSSCLWCCLFGSPSSCDWCNNICH